MATRPVLVPKLLAEGHEVHVIDTMWFGNSLTDHKNLKVEVGNVNKINESFDLSGIDGIIHLASIANDPQETSTQSLLGKRVA